MTAPREVNINKSNDTDHTTNRRFSDLADGLKYNKCGLNSGAVQVRPFPDLVGAAGISVGAVGRPGTDALA